MSPTCSSWARSSTSEPGEPWKLMPRKREGAADGIVAPTCGRSAHLLNSGHHEDRCFFLRCYRNPLAGDGVRRYTRCRFARPTTVAWALLDDGDAESIRSAVATGHHDAACGLLLNRAIELLSLAAAMPETTLPV